MVFRRPDSSPRRNTARLAPIRLACPRSRFVALALALLVPFCLAAFLAGAPARAQVLLPPAAPAAAPAPAPAIDPQTQALIDILEDDEARARLVQTLRAGAGAPPPEAVRAPEAMFIGGIADNARAIAEQISGVFLLAGNTATLISSLWFDTTRSDLAALGRVLAMLGAVIAVTFVAFWLLRLAAEAIRARFSRAALVSRLPRRILLAISALAVDVATLALAWVIGNSFAAYLGATGIMRLNQTLFLNAFLVAEGMKVAIRAGLAPRQTGLRLLPISDLSAAYWHFWLARVVSLLAYAFLFLAPAAAWHLSFGSAEAIRIITVFAACVIGIVVTLQNKVQVRALLLRRTVNGQTDLLARVYGFLARFWHVFAVIYFIAIFVVWISRPRSALDFMIPATVETVIAIVVGVIVAGFISRLISGGMRLPQDIRERLPLLEARLNAFVPRILGIVRLIVLAGVLIAVLNAWEVFNFLEWASSGVGLSVTTALLSATVILLAGLAAYLVVSSWIEYKLNDDFGEKASARERTLLALFRSAFTVTLSVIVAIMVLAELGVNIGPLLAGAGVVGLAVGFGAQKLVQDVISGIFIQLENAMNVGDVVAVGGISGVVERLTIRSVAIRDLTGVYHVVPFSAVDTVSNMMRSFSYHVADIGVAYRENIADVKQAMQDAFDLLAAMPDHDQNIIGPFEMLGVNAFADSAVIVRGRIKTQPGKQWATGRAYNEIIKQVFDERGIEIPFPHVTLYPGEDKQGRAPALHIEARRARRPQEDAPQSPPAAEPSPDEAISGPVTQVREESGGRPAPDPNASLGVLEMPPVHPPPREP